MGCASTSNNLNFEGYPTPSAKADPSIEAIRVFARLSGGSRASIRVPPAQYEYYLRVGQTAAGESTVSVCSKARHTQSRVPRSSCSGAHQGLNAPWLGQTNHFFEELIARAVARQLEEGTLNLEARPLFVDVSQELDDLNLVAFFQP